MTRYLAGLPLSNYHEYGDLVVAGRGGFGMARHRAARRRRLVWVSPVLLLAATGAAVYYFDVLDLMRDDQLPNAAPEDDTFDVDWCTQLRIVTTSSYRPVLTEIAPLVASGDTCIQLNVEVANGVDALSRVADSGTHVWIPDDGAWAGAGDQLALDADAPGAGTVVATSPIYMVTDQPTATLVRDAGASWLGLSTLLSDGTSGPTLVLQDPERSGDGLVAAGAVGESVWLDAGMDASAQALTAALPSMRIVQENAVPAEPGEIGLVPEYVMVDLLASGDSASHIRGAELLAGTDNTAMLRYTWLPTGVGADDPDVMAAMERVLSVLTGDESADARERAGLRGPNREPVTADGDTFPPLEGEPFEVFSAHAVDHVFATFYAEHRRADVHLVIDISGSMAAAAPSGDASRLDVVKQGLQAMVEILPDDAGVGLWQFGSLLDPPNDWVELVGIGPLEDQRGGLDNAVSGMAPIETGTGLYNTMLDVYLHAQANYRDGVPNHAVVLTDGRNEDRPGSLTAEELQAELVAAHDPERPVHLTLVALGAEPDTELLVDVLEPLDSYITQVSTAEEITAAFIHVAAGGVHH